MIRARMIVAAAAAAFAITPIVPAQREEARAQRQRIEQLVREAGRAAQAGQPERERAARREAEQLAAQLEREIVRLHREREQLQQRERQLRDQQVERQRAAERERAAAEERHIAIIEGLERGVWALRELGAGEEAERLAQIAERVRQRDVRAGREADRPQRDRPPRTERQVALEQLEVMRLAMPALREAERHDAAELLELAIHQRELNLEGRREQAAELRGRAPNRAQLAEILGLAAELWADFGRPERARAVGELARQVAPRQRDSDVQERQSERDRAPAQPDERDDMRRRLEVLRIAMHGLLEGERGDAAHVIERAIHLHEMALEGQEDEAQRIFEEEGPRLEQIVRALGMATELWQQFGHEGRAESVAALQREVAEHMRTRQQERDRSPAQVERMQRQLDEMTRAMDEMRAHMEQMRRQIEEQQRRDR